MSPRTVRRAERAAHLTWGLLIVLYVYGLLPSWGEPLMRWVTVPAIVGSGFAMWFTAPLRRLVRTVGRGERRRPASARVSSTTTSA